MISANNFKTGDILDDYADFRFVECVFCKCQYIHDFELCTLFYDPNDLERSFSTLFGCDEDKNYPLPCRKCKRTEWDFTDIDNDERENVLKGEWGWAI
ncbi:hypothetical protein E2K98_28355 [Bacillus salipaludis]|uniref:Uncharacterized protein n=1 Tax=Bacillus salipaludis TaxID=2547811 RepID=A0A4V3ASX8_9BACI|nr:hypothetical protein [Bacillus salipaludis]MDQ6596430.1 hypothetical protein [Bacillus salipaludis]TDK55377.1 hypothetical protein E2K98_28355 [Bacillus salipaludis]